jgi:hypothetical protein
LAEQLGRFTSLKTGAHVQNFTKIDKSGRRPRQL